MSLRRRSKLTACGIGCLAVTLLFSWTFAQRNAEHVAPENLLPARSIVFIKSNGSLATQEAFQKTACCQALYESGLVPAIEDALESLPGQGNFPFEEQLDEAIEHLEKHGLSIALTDGEQIQPWGMIVVHNAVGGADFLNDILAQVPQVPLDFQEIQRSGRVVTLTMIPNSPVELGWWEEQGHLVIAVGIDAIRSAIAVAQGDAPNLTENPLYEQYLAANDDVTIQSIGWFDFGSLRRKFNDMPIPLPNGERLTIEQALKVIGLDTLDYAVAFNGYQDEAMWTEQFVHLDGEPTGLMALTVQENLTWDDLPPLPVGQAGMFAVSFDLEQAYHSVWGILENIAEIAPGPVMRQANQGIAEFERELGFTPLELLSSIGNVHCLYADKSQGLFGLGGAVVCSVNDADRLREILSLILDKVEEESRGEVTTIDVQKRGRTLTMFRMENGAVLTPAICIDDEWAVFGLVPQAVESFLMRADGDLPTWKPEGEFAEALSGMPEEFATISIVDPRETYQFLMGLAPVLLSGAEIAMRESGEFPDDFELPITPASFPPNELILAPLFPNVIMSTVEGTTIHGYARQSLPGIPFVGGSDGTAVIAATGIAVALLLPAVQQGREAARRTQSRNNLKMMGLALHNYHDTFRELPPGTLPNDDLEPSERLSWTVAILPYLDQAALYQRVDLDGSWDQDVLSTVVPAYRHPSEPDDLVRGVPVTNYLGMAGVGENAETLPPHDPKAGMFGVNEPRKFRDVLDGLSNTIAVGESDDPQPWAAGSATIRPLTKKPYINGGNGYGSKSPGGANFLLGDGSVRFISENIDPEVMEALSTIRGNELIGDF